MKRSKWLRRVALMTALLLAVGSLGGCASGDGGTAASADLLTTVLDRGELVVTLNLGNEPWGYTDADGGYAGMAVDLIEGFAESIGVTATFSPLEFSSMIPAIQAGKADIICTNLTRSASRATSVTFTEPVGSSYVVAVVRRDTIGDLSELNDPDITLTTESGTVHEGIAAENFPEATMSSVNQNADAIAALKAGRADAFLTDLTIAQAACEADDTITYLETPVYVDTFAFAVRCDAASYTFVEAFNTYLRLIKGDGTYAALYEQHFGEAWTPLYTETGM